MAKIRYEEKRLEITQGSALFTLDCDTWCVKANENSYSFYDAKDIQVKQDGNSVSIYFTEVKEGLDIVVKAYIEDDHIAFTLDASKDEVEFDEMVFPGVVHNTKGNLVLPTQMGSLLDTSENIAFTPGFGGYFGCADAYVNGLGFYSSKQSYLWIADTYHDSGYQVVNGTYSEIMMRTIASMAHVSYTRKYLLYVYDGCFDYNAMAACIRAYWDKKKHIVTLKEKVQKKPILEKLVGSCVYHTGIHTKFCKDSRYYHPEGANESIVPIFKVQKTIHAFHDSGIQTVHLHLDGCGIAYDNKHPRFYPIDERTGGYPALRELIQSMHADGDILTLHDNYHDLYFDSPDFKEEYQIYDVHMKPYYMAVWAGGKQSYMTGQMAPKFVKRNQDYLHEQGVYSDGLYCDVFTCNPFDENFNPDYRMDRRECAQYRNDTFDVVSDNGMIVSSEEVNVFAINHLDTCHYAPYPFMMKEDGKQIGKPIPFFNLVFHDCLVIPFMTDYVNGKNYGLYALLNGGIPYLKRDGAYVNTDGSFSEDVVDEERLAFVKKATAFEKEVAYAKMIKHEFIEGEENKQRSIFDNGYQVEIDLTNNTFNITKQ